MNPIAILSFLRTYGWIIAAALFAWWVLDMRSDLQDAQEKIEEQRAELINERAARQADVAGLTALAQGTAKAAIDNSRDAAALAETINVQAPAPASPGLAALLERLRSDDTAASKDSAASPR